MFFFMYLNRPCSRVSALLANDSYYNFVLIIYTLDLLLFEAYGAMDSTRLFLVEQVGQLLNIGRKGEKVNLFDSRC